MDGSYFSDTQITNKYFKSIATVRGYNLYEIVLVGTGGLIVTSNDNGRSWQVQNAGSRDNFSSVDCTSGNTSGICYLVSESNIMKDLKFQFIISCSILLYLLHYLSVNRT